MRRHTSANLLPTQALREEYEIDEQEVAYGVSNKHCKRAWVPIARLFSVVGSKLVID